MFLSNTISISFCFIWLCWAQETTNQNLTYRNFRDYQKAKKYTKQHQSGQQENEKEIEIKKKKNKQSHRNAYRS